MKKGEMLEGGIRLSNEDGQVYHHLGKSLDLQNTQWFLKILL